MSKLQTEDTITKPTETPLILGDDGLRILTKIESGYDFWALFESLLDDGSLFFQNRAVIVEAYRTGMLWGLSVSDRYPRGTQFDTVLLTPYLLPCLCVVNTTHTANALSIEILWTHSRARRNGFAKVLIELISKLYKKLVSVSTPLPESILFWHAMQSDSNCCIDSLVWPKPNIITDGRHHGHIKKEILNGTHQSPKTLKFDQ